MPGKIDWLARNLPAEGEFADVQTAGRLARRDVVTRALDERVGDVREQVEASPYGFALVVHDGDMVLGRLRMSEMKKSGDDATAEQVMSPGPSTVRADTTAEDLAERLADRDLRTALVTTPEGRLIGVVTRAELEAAGRE